MFGRATFIVGVIFNIFLLAFFKYTAFLLESISKINWVEPIETSILLPLAISFFTFQQIGYLTEIYRSKPPEKNLLQYALFVSFFPQLIAGPIVQHHHVSYQFENIVSINSRLWLASSGLILFAIGLSKKLLLADTLAKTANRVFDGVANGSNVSLGGLAWNFFILIPNLFRFFWLFRHGDRAWLDFWNLFADKFSITIQINVYNRVLAKLAHHTIKIFARLSLHPTGVRRAQYLNTEIS